MQRTTILAEDELLLQLRSIAQRLGLSISEVIRRALRDYVGRAKPARSKLSIVGVGSSGGKLKISERHEDLLFVRDRPVKRSRG